MKITSEQVQKYTRIVFYFIIGAMVHDGVVRDGAPWIEQVAGVVLFAANFAWTLYGDRLNAKLSEIAKSPEVQAVIVSTQAQADAVTSQKVQTQ